MVIPVGPSVRPPKLNDVSDASSDTFQLWSFVQHIVRVDETAQFDNLADAGHFRLAATSGHKSASGDATEGTPEVDGNADGALLKEDREEGDPFQEGIPGLPGFD